MCGGRGQLKVWYCCATASVVASVRPADAAADSSASHSRILASLSTTRKEKRDDDPAPRPPSTFSVREATSAEELKATRSPPSQSEPPHPMCCFSARARGPSCALLPLALAWQQQGYARPSMHFNPPTATAPCTRSSTTASALPVAHVPSSHTLASTTHYSPADEDHDGGALPSRSRLSADPLSVQKSVARLWSRSLVLTPVA